jgi:hypothetical protein
VALIRDVYAFASVPLLWEQAWAMFHGIPLLSLSLLILLTYNYNSIELAQHNSRGAAHPQLRSF